MSQNQHKNDAVPSAGRDKDLVPSVEVDRNHYLDRWARDTPEEPMNVASTAYATLQAQESERTGRLPNIDEVAPETPRPPRSPPTPEAAQQPPADSESDVERIRY